MKNSSQLWWRCRSWRAPGLSTVQPTTWSAPADALSIRNCTCMSTQPSLRLRPATFGTSRILVRYIFAGFLAAPARLTFRLLFRMARFTICVLRRRGSLPFDSGGASRLSPQAAIDLMRGDEIAMIEPQPAASIHHFVCGRRQRHRAAELAAELERQQHVLLLQRDIGERDGGHLPLQDEGPAIGQHRRGRDALEDRVDRDLARDPAFFRERDRLAEGDDFHHEQEVDRDLHLHRETAGADIGHLRPDGAQHGLDALEGRLVPADHDRRVALRQRDRTARNRRIEHGHALLGEFGGDRAARVRRDRAHVDIDAALRQAGDDAVAAERDRSHRRRVGYDREHDVAGRGDRARRRRQPHAGGNQRLGLLLAPVPARDRVARGHEPRDNAGAHGAEANETDVHAFTPLDLAKRDDAAEPEQRLDNESVAPRVPGAAQAHSTTILTWSLGLTRSLGPSPLRTRKRSTGRSAIAMRLAKRSTVSPGATVTILMCSGFAAWLSPSVMRRKVPTDSRKVRSTSAVVRLAAKMKR